MFNFNTQSDSDIYKTLSGLIKNNNGQFKSFKQAQFLGKTYRKSRDGFDTVDSTYKNFGIEISEAQYMVFAEANVRWAEYGTKSYRPVTWVFVMDEHGVVDQYKMSYIGDMRTGTRPDPTKTTKLWTRVGEVVPLEVPPAPVLTESLHFGALGERVVFSGVIKSVIEFQRSVRFSYYDSGLGYVTKLDVDGNDLVYFGHLGEKGTTVKVKATIKDHTIRDGRKQTIIARPKVMV